ncbi:MAG: hypothetical protein Q8R20_00995 [Nanoarchaeota archaeon]|nr:hypothetical protein [Nanoarchaeota archaeon]
MKLKKFIKKLQEIKEKYGDNAEVIMADYIPVVDPVFLSDKNMEDKVVITDQK